MRKVPNLDPPEFVPSVHKKMQEHGLTRKEYDTSPWGHAKKIAGGRLYYHSEKGAASRARRKGKPKSEASRTAGRRYKQTDKGKATQTLQNHKRRAINMKAGGSFTREDDAALRVTQKKCYLCGTPFTRRNPATIDHIVPLAKGGLHDKTNIALAHRSCNIKKNATRTHLI
jgi:5-methylcytosine-specific restriction endonuclease McrA